VTGRLPPVSELATGTLVLCVVAAVFVAGSAPHRPPMAVVWVLIGAAALLLAAGVVLLARTPSFAWRSFFLVARWSLVGYAVIAGMIEYAFLYDHTPQPQLAAMSAVLALFAVDVPLVLAFAVARHQPASG